MSKDKILQIRVSDEYHEKLKKLAIERDISVSLLIRNAIEYIPGTETQEEIKKGLDYAKVCDSSAMLFALKNISDAIRDTYNYEFDYKLPENKELLDMNETDIFRGIKQIVLKSIINDFAYTPNYKIDKETETILKELIVKYVER